MLGIAVEAKKRYPEMFEEYKTRCKQFGNKNLGDVQFHFSKNGKILANMFAQDGISGKVELPQTMKSLTNASGKYICLHFVMVCPWVSHT